MPGTVDEGRDPVKRSMRLLAALVESPQSDWGVRELATALATAPSTVHRLLLTLTELDLVQSSNGRYRVGAEFRRLARLALSGVSLEAVALPHVRDLVAATDESAIAGSYDPAHFRYSLVLSIDSGHPLQYVQTLNQWVPVHIGAIGIAITAALPDDARSDYLARAELQAYTEHTPNTSEAVESACRVAVERGYALTRGHKLPGAVGIAAPVFAFDAGEAIVAGAVSLTVPEQRFDERSTDEIAGHVMRCAAGISADLGVVEPPDAWAAAWTADRVPRGAAAKAG